jgi:agmatinase
MEEKNTPAMKRPLHTLPLTFGGLPREETTWNKARVVFLSVPYDLTSTYFPGSRRGPLAILEASTHMELFDEELEMDISRIGFHTLDSLEAVACGPQEMVQAIAEYARPVIAANKFPVLLGGEHTVTLGTAGLLHRKHPQLCFLQLDAHADLRENYEGTPFSHACVGRRLAEWGSLVQVGIRSLSEEENAFLKRERHIQTFYAHRLSALPDWQDTVCAALGPKVYVTIDLDVLDPAIMPAVGTPEPGGLHWQALTRLLRQVAQEKEVVGFDVVELSPIPGLIAPDFLAAKLIYKFLGEIFRSPRRREH